LGCLAKTGGRQRFPTHTIYSTRRTRATANTPPRTSHGLQRIAGFATRDSKNLETIAYISLFFKVTVSHSAAAVFQIRIQSGQWISIRIRNPDPDPGGQTHKSRKN